MAAADMSVAIVSGAVTISGITAGQAAMAASLPVVIASNQSTVPTQTNVATSGGCSVSRKLSENNTTGISAKASAGQVYGWYITNTNAAARYVKIYNKATAPAVGTDTPIMTLVIPGNATGAGTNVAFNPGIAFATGIGYGITTGIADNDTGAPAANEVVVNLFYA